MERKSFGTKIAYHQAIQFMLADMAAGTEIARLMSRKAAWEVDQVIVWRISSGSVLHPIKIYTIWGRT